MLILYIGDGCSDGAIPCDFLWCNKSMNALFKKPSIANRQMDRIQREVSPLNTDIRYLSRTLPTADPTTKPPIDYTKLESASLSESLTGNRETMRSRSARVRTSLADRFPDFVSGSFESTRPLRHERRLQRNKAIVMLVFLGLVLFIMVSRFI